MLSRSQRNLRAVEKKMEEHADAAEAIIAKSEAEDRDRSEEENAEIAEHQKSLKTLRENRRELEEQIAVETEVTDLGRAIGKADDDEQTKAPVQITVGKSFGDQFIESDAYKSQREKGFSGKYSSGLVELETKATLTEGDNPLLGGGTPGTGGALVPIDQRPGVQPTLFERLTVADLLASATTVSNAIHYVEETVATNAAGVVEEGEDKPESALEFDFVQQPVKKIATFLPTTDEMMEDAPAIRGFINGRLSLFVQMEEEEQLLHGAGGSNFLGLMPRVPPANEFVQSDAVDPNNADHIYAALSAARRSFLEPDGIVINPDDWEALRLLKDDNGMYIAGSPFSTGPGEPTERLWGKRVVVTEAMIAGAALVGAFSTAAQVFRRSGLTVEASNSHEDFFQKNLTAIRAEERLALAVYRPQSFAIADLGYAS